MNPHTRQKKHDPKSTFHSHYTDGYGACIDSTTSTSNDDQWYGNSTCHDYVGTQCLSVEFEIITLMNSRQEKHNDTVLPTLGCSNTH